MINTPGVDVLMVNRDVAAAPRYEMPAGYHMRFYREGDADVWERIQIVSDLYFVAGVETLANSMPGDTAHLAARVMFLVDPAGVDIGTISAWDDSDLDGTPMGHIHWVAIMPAAQGRGLGKPMMTAALDVMCRRGDTAAWLETNTARIPALNLYLHFGFVPYIHNDEERTGWRAVAPALKYPLQV
jgi:ribosomal protein S18 acetylase RimI-like enzyme